MRCEDAIAGSALLAGSAGFLFDFDGVLAAIDVDPATVEPVPGAIPALCRLAARVARVEVISARPVAFLRSRFFNAPAIMLHGLYGLEAVGPDGRVRTHPDALAWVPVIQDVAERATRELPSDLLVEDKRLSTAVHYRSAPHLETLVGRWAEEQAARLGLRLERGRMVCELRPPLDWDKGTVVALRTADLRCGWYFGDDIADLRAFQALTDRAARDPSFLGVRVAVQNPETGSDVARAADIVLSSPADLPRLLDRLTAAIDRDGQEHESG